MNNRVYLSHGFLCALVAAGCGSDAAMSQPDMPDAGSMPDAAPEQVAAYVGHWTSPICETRPDGQGGFTYVKRDFTIEADGSWTGTIDFFGDASCTMPVSTAAIGGTYESGAESAAVHGAREAIFHLDAFELTPLAGFFVDLLNSAEPGSCGESLWELDVAQDIVATDGCSVLGIDHETCPAEHELVYVLGGQLFFGGRPEDGENLCTPERRPITLQTPLLADEGVVDSADPTTAIAGRWTSPICETRPDGQGGFTYVKRDFTIEAGGSWAGTIDFFGDAGCTMPVSTAAIGGAYELGAASTTVHGATEATFHLDVFGLTPRADFFVDLLNGAEPGTCGESAWALGVEQDILATNGCSALGIDHDACPAEHELVHVLADRLCFGGRPEDGESLCTPERRPITLQTPLLRR